MKGSGAKTLTRRPSGRPRKVLLFRTAAGPSIGFGHLRRSLILARRLRGHALPVFLLDSSDIGSREQVALCGYEFAYFDARNPWPSRPGISALVVDTRVRPGLLRLIAEARRHRVPVASIHDLGLAPVASDVVIDGSIMPGNARAGRNGAARYYGTDYLILNEAWARSRRRSRSMSSRIRRIAINLGGGDGSSFYPRILQGLKDTGAALQVTGFPGFCDWGQQQLAHADWGGARFRWIHPREDAATVISHADLVFSAGGLSAFEALCLGVPLCALAYDRYQAKTVAALTRAGAAVNLGLGAALSPSAVAEHFRELDSDSGLRQRLARSGRRLVDGKGAVRVANILRALLHDGGRSILKKGAR